MYFDPINYPDEINLVNPYNHRKYFVLDFHKIGPNGELFYGFSTTFDDGTILSISTKYCVLRGEWDLTLMIKKGWEIFERTLPRSRSWQNNPQAQFFALCSCNNQVVSLNRLQDLIIKSGLSK